MSSNVIKRLFMLLIAMAMGGVVSVGLWRVVRRTLRFLEAGVVLRPDEVLTLLVALAALLGTAWLSLAVVVELLARLPGHVGRAARVVAAVVTPVLVRRTFGLLLGVGVGVGLHPGDASAASVGLVSGGATPSPVPTGRPLPDPGWAGWSPASHQQGTPAAIATVAPDPGWVPAAPTVRPQPDVRVLSAVPRSQADDDDTATEVVVRRGDSLWSIAARQLGPDPSEAEIAEAWPAWYAANREVIGSDPDVLLPGQVLRMPEVVRP